MVWQYVNPAVPRWNSRPKVRCPAKNVRGHLFNAVFKAHRYAPDYAGFQGRDLTPKRTHRVACFAERQDRPSTRGRRHPGERPPRCWGQRWSKGRRQAPARPIGGRT